MVALPITEENLERVAVCPSVSTKIAADADYQPQHGC
jgi:hypothetical protein